MENQQPPHSEAALQPASATGLLHRFHGTTLDNEQRERERKEGRNAGKLTSSLRQSLRSCNILQLENVKGLCDRYIADQKLPPREDECGEHFTVAVLASDTHKNQRYRLEVRRSAIKGNKLYLNGPYLYAYRRDGKFIKSRYFKKSQWKTLPRKIKRLTKPFIDESFCIHENERITEEINSGTRKMWWSVNDAENQPRS